ncbi:MAG: OprO/OprP family phosphate-selective porin [Prevotella sp.]|nr:OprO/OprP family phosphate-selective porin [Prevotella sp.]
MMKRLITLGMMALALAANAQEKKTTTIEVPQWVKDMKLSGYGMLQYQGLDKEDAHENSFQLRMFRVSLEGRIAKDFYWKGQIQLNGNTSSLGSSPRVVDLFGEWQKYDFLRIKAGQFKRPFSFENPMHPITQGFMSYSQPISKLVGFSDRTGEQASNGRDIGVQLQGDFLKNANGRNLMHYQVGVFNGEGINTKDADNRKDVIGGVWVMPVKGMRIGAFGWTGSRVITYTQGKMVVPKNRYALSAEYVTDNDWTFRTEYVHSQGYGSNLSAGDKADGYYALCIAPVIERKLHVKARYDLYRDRKEWGTSKTYYEVGADYLFNKNLQLNIEYARVNDKTITAADKHSYNMVDVELDFKF